MGSITIRIPDELESKIDEQRGDKPKSDFYRDILSEYVSKPAYNLNTPVSSNTGHIQSLEQQISLLKDQNTDLRSSNSKLMILINQEQALHLQTQRLLPAPDKKWWIFWK